MDQIQEIANQLGCAIENIIPQYTQMQISGHLTVAIVCFFIVIASMTISLLDWKTDKMEGFGFAIGGAIGIFTLPLLGFSVYKVIMWINFPDMMFLENMLP